MNIGIIEQIIASLVASIYLTYILIVTNSNLTRIVIVPVSMFTISLFLKNVSLILNKDKIAKIFSKINTISFFIYSFGFLIYWDHSAIVEKEYMLVVFSLLFWVVGIFIAYRKYLKSKNEIS